MLNTYRICERDGFPLVKIEGRWECVAEYLNRYIGGQRIVDMVQRGNTVHYVFENGHELPLLCFCCGEPLVVDDWESTRQDMCGRWLESMSIGSAILTDGREMLQFRLEFSGKGLFRRRGVVEALDVEVAAQMRHPDDCPYKHGVPAKRRGRPKRSRRRR